MRCKIPFSVPWVILVLSLVCSPVLLPAHRSGCHRWHSCPSDRSTYVCGDLGYCSQCPDNQFCVAGQPRTDTSTVVPALPQPSRPLSQTPPRAEEATEVFVGEVVGITDGDTL